MVFRVVDRLFVVVYGASDPSDAEWRSYLSAVRAHGVERTMQLVFTPGGAPSARQRQELERIIAGRSVPVAVVATSLRVRAAVALLSWLTPSIRVFAPARLREAIGYLDMPASRTELIMRVLADLRAQEERRARASA